jgi:hypothetical protein
VRFSPDDIFRAVVVRAEEGRVEAPVLRAFAQLGKGAMRHAFAPPGDAEQRSELLGREPALLSERGEAELVGLEVDEGDEADMLVDAGNDLVFEEAAVGLAHRGKDDDLGGARAGVDVASALAPWGRCGPVEEVGADDEIGSKLDREAGGEQEIFRGAGGAAEVLPVPEDAVVPGHGPS